MRTKCKAGVIATTLLLAACASQAGTWYANAANSGRSRLDGRSEATAWGTLQDAHDNADAGDTILVLPGDYGQGSGTAVDGHASRLVVSKPLTFVSTVPKAAHIVGRHGADADGRGSGAVRCICVTADGAGTTFKDFTIRDGATPTSGGSDPLNTVGQGSPRAGGGLHVLGATGAGKTAAARKVYLVDCVVSNCVASWGGAMFGGTAIRCLLKDNAGVSWGETACQASLWNTVIACNRSLAASNEQRPTLGNYVIAVNCSISGCCGDGARRSVSLYNCVFTGQESTETNADLSISSSSPSVFSHCYGRSADFYPFLSPATGDFRPRAGSPIVGGGVTACLTDNIVLPEGTAMTDFNGNPLNLAKAACDAGAVQGAVMPKGGRLDFAGAAEVNGFRNLRASYSYATEWPATVAISPVETNFFRISLGGFTAGFTPFRYADRNGLVQMLYPPHADKATTVTPQVYDFEFWCNPDAVAASADGSRANPFRTLQAAMDAISDAAYAGKRIVVRAMPGEYSEGGDTCFGHANRVVLPASRSMLLASTGGAAVTTIKGKIDPATADAASYPGCGADAMRCVAFDGTSVSDSASRAIQGFTLADGRSGKTDYTHDVTGDRVGGVYAGSAAISDMCQILDCVFTNCAAVRGGAAYYGWHSRCRYYDCHGFGGVTRYATLSACYVDPSCTLGPAPSDAIVNTVIGTETATYLCTIPASSYHESVTKPHCCTLFGDQSVVGPALLWGSFFRRPSSVDTAAEGYSITDPQYVDFDGGDCRVARTSPAISGGRLPETGTPAWGLYATNVWKFASSDVDARPIKITEGRIMSGCHHDPVRGLYVSAENGGMALSGASTGFSKLADGLSATVTAGNPGARPCIGYTVNGVTNRFDEVASRVVTAADADDDGLFVAALYTTDWYVNADVAVGDDSKTGFTPATAKRTLAAALACAAPGDTVHAATGVYAAGSATPTGAAIAARALVPSGVTLEGAGAGKSFIVGERSADESDFGRGDGTMHCAYLGTGAVVRGFTLTGGGTKSGWSDQNASKADWHGAGACGASNDADGVAATRVEDCIVSNCVAICGGAGYGVTFVRSRLFNCHARRGSATELCGLVNTIVDKCTSDGGSGLAVNSSFPIINATIGPDIKAAGDAVGTALNYQSAFQPKEYGVLNTVILGSVSTTITLMTNCVFTVGTVSSKMHDCRKLTVVQIALDGAYRPDISSSGLVNGGLATDACGDSDVYGGQRIYDGAIDIGAVEADWRSRYATDISGSGSFSVTAASPDVVEAEGVVRLPEGASLSARWLNGGSSRISYSVALRLDAGSAVTVMLNGETLESFDTEGLHELKFCNSLALNDLTFSCASGTAEILSSNRICGMKVIIR